MLPRVEVLELHRSSLVRGLKARLVRGGVHRGGVPGVSGSSSITDMTLLERDRGSSRFAGRIVAERCMELVEGEDGQEDGQEDVDDVDVLMTC